ncbi:hypothetical protein [Frigoriglobus tundricola]|uniref:Uncharacterized protein n=1 Tax=Frigoriglobus tundricola TaxID=2774151 RepID=A0A6M5YYW3_9BACT|nr:hypothetical protein [Frigoriglobus tundricola]QJW99219.1 hypothetical protein FTUN_6821 [Frigoriglobus tundricola]
MHSARFTPAVWSPFFVIFCAHAAPAQETTAVLEEVRDRHRAALEAIRTLAYSYELQTLKSEPMQFRNQMPAHGGVGVAETGPGEFWQSPDARRSRTLWSDGATVDEVHRHGRLLRTRTPKVPDPESRMEITLETRSDLECGWHLSLLFEHWGRDVEFLPFHGVLQQPHQLRRVERLPAAPDGKPGDIRVELAHDRGVYEFWFSPSHNYLIRKVIEHPTDQPQHRHEQEVAAFAEPNPGQFFPARIDYRSFQDDALKYHTRRILSDVQLNRPIPAAAFRVPGIEGGWCQDLKSKTGFRVDADGYRIGKPQPIPVSGELIQPPPRPTKTPPAQEHPISLWVGLAVAVLALCLCAALFEIRHLRSELKKKATL